MSKNKGYNSILFLTTLSVYLGLVLVGAPSSVLAQQVALTQRFEIQNEFESEDDLDKKPDDETLEGFLLVRLDAALNEFVEDLRELNSRGKYKSNLSFSTGYSYNYCSGGRDDGTSSISFDRDQDKKIFDLQIKLRKNLNIANVVRNIEELPNFIEASVNDTFSNDQTHLCKKFIVGFSLDKSEFDLSISFSQNSQNALITAENLNSLFSIKALNAQNAVSKQFYENTRAKAENQYISVVTRLPRGSLNALVKSEKQAN